MIYGYIFEDSYVDLDKDAEREHPSPFSCSHLLQFKIFTADAAVREELAEAWYRASVFWSTDPWNMASSLYQIGWSAGLKPADSLRNGLWPFHEIRNVVVTIPVQFGSDVAKETLVLGKLHCLSLLKKSTTFWFILEGPGNFACLEKDHSDAENYAKSIWYLSSEVRRLRRDGFKVFVTPDWSRTVLFGMEETTVEELTEKVQQAIEESSTY
ncbi:hypothetical protein J4E83_010489 [Alternaria metachromatica]|uniref:uncharacterized protein n=1 Tax=Alternaria metachromatica TaxID=283354 RepID=UPI0020C35705|nr:uncharacterized protein J4E83_010489 [Alternaria metachromatica]KAI4605826.1 hypothetical protein J4E83_010489 [Alternaria metachromatica]